MPKGNNHTGKVVIFNSLLQNTANISGEQMGSYFGYSLATADINGDGYVFFSSFLILFDLLLNTVLLWLCGITI